MAQFHYRRSLKGLTRAQQGYIHYLSQMYRILPPEMKQTVRRCCREAGGEYHRAVMEYMTTDSQSTEICMRHYLSQSTLERCVRKYYRLFPLPGKEEKK